MSDLRPFKEIKLQWLMLLSCDASLSDTAVRVALYIVTKHINGQSEKAWPSHQTIATAIGKSTKTVQRAVAALEKKWFDLERGNGSRISTRYSPSESSLRRANDERKKGDKIVHLHPNKGGQNCPQRVTKVSSEGGQKCPPNLEKEPRKELNARTSQPPTANRVRVNSNSDPELFRRCGELTNRTGLVGNDGSWSFDQSVVARAQRDLAVAVGVA